MEIIRELEEEFSAKRWANSLGRTSVRTSSNVFHLDEARLAPDFVLGRSGNRIYFFPNPTIFELSGIEVKQSIDDKLASILSEQRQPVKLLLSNGPDTDWAWLLNVEGQWLRVAGQAGVIWIPLSRLVVAEMDLLVGDSKP
jgi:hypothetical protein